MNRLNEISDLLLSDIKLSTKRSQVKHFNKWLENLQGKIRSEGLTMYQECFQGIKNEMDLCEFYSKETDVLYYEKIVELKESDDKDQIAKVERYLRNLRKRQSDMRVKITGIICKTLKEREWQAVPSYKQELAKIGDCEPTELLRIIKKTVVENVNTNYYKIEKEMRSYRQTYYNKKLNKYMIANLEDYLQEKMCLIEQVNDLAETDAEKYEDKKFIEVIMNGLDERIYDDFILEQIH